MNRNILSIKEYELLKEILAVTASIQKIYNTLYQLEISNKKDSNEYQTNLDYLDMTLEVEKSLYNQINKDLAEKIYIVINRFLDKQNSEIIRRILNIISNNFIFDEIEVIDLLPDEITDSLVIDDLKDLDEEVNQFISGSVEVYKMFRKDILTASLVILKEFVNDEKFESIRKSLIRYKYNLLFKNKDVESVLLANNLDLPDTLSINSQVLAHFYSIEKQEYDSLKEHFCINGVINEIEYLLQKKDDDFKDIKGQILLILKQCLIRGYLLLMEDESIEEVSDEFHSILTDDNYMDEHYEDEKSEKLIIKSLKLAKKDKNKRLVLTMED